MMTDYLELEYSSTPASETKLAQRVSEVLAASGVDPADQHAFSLAISEAFTNAIIHGNAYDREKTIKVRLDINKSWLRADIIDQGVDGLMKVTRPRRTDLLADGGRGIGLIEHYVTEVQFEQTEEGGLKVSIVLKRKQPMNGEQELIINNGGHHGNQSD